jgi:ABC-type transport system involved in cytochrome bd biosynthesis fused ATPase/permease subunit
VIDFVNSDVATNVSSSSQWQPLIEVGGDLKNGTRCLARIERRITQTENRLIGHSLITDRNTNLNFSINRSYSKGQKVSILGKESTVRSNINLGLSGAYEKQSGETKQAGVEGIQNQVSRDRISVNAQGGYSFSNNLTGNLEFGFGQNRNLVIGQVTRSLRVELRAQFTF